MFNHSAPAWLSLGHWAKMKALIFVAAVLLMSSVAYATLPATPTTIVVSVKGMRVEYAVDGKTLKENEVYEYLKTQFDRFGFKYPIRIVVTKESPFSEPIKIHHSIKELGFKGEIEFYVAYPTIQMTTYFANEIIDWKCLYKFQIDQNPQSK
jgi:hypothetical protein